MPHATVLLVDEEDLARWSPTAAINAGLPSARLLGGFAQSALLILFGGVVLGLSLAFGFAGRDLARELLERLARKGEPPREDTLRHL